jgi:ribosomal protein L24E
MPKNYYDQYDTKCTRCRDEVYAGGGNQFVDDNGVLQRYCLKCHKKWWQELERKYDAAAAKSAAKAAAAAAASAPPADPGTGGASKPAEIPKPPDDRPAPVVEQLPPPPTDVVGPQGDGASGPIIP